jgi:hypothetical protein
MRLTCPFCKSSARLKPNPAHALHIALPLYVLKCTGCERTSIRVERASMPDVALATA